MPDTTAAETIIVEMRSEVDRILAEINGGCFNPTDDPRGECADRDCYCAHKCTEVARACWSVITKNGTYRRGMLRAAEIAEHRRMGDDDEYGPSYDDACADIAAAIRAEAGEE